MSTEIKHTQSSAWISCSFGGISLLIPKIDVHSEHPVTALDDPVTDGLEAGWLPMPSVDDVWPAYRLDRDLKITQNNDQLCKVVLFLSSGQFTFGIYCETIRFISNSGSLQLTKMPFCLQSDTSPIEALALLDQQQVLYVTNANILKQCLHNQAPVH